MYMYVYVCTCMHAWMYVCVCVNFKVESIQYVVMQIETLGSNIDTNTKGKNKNQCKWIVTGQ